MQKKVMLIDGNSIINRAFYGVPLLSNQEGLYTNGVYGFLNILFKLLEEEKPAYLGVAFDLSAPTFRHIKYKEYKGTRKGMPEELRPQMPLLKEALDKMGVKRFELEGYEADDLLGTLSKKAEEEGYEAVVVSGDRDLLQLASDTLKVRIPKTRMGRTTVEDYYAVDVVAKYGVTPTEFIDLKALMGDVSDNIPGVPGIGEKTAIKIIKEYHDIEAAIAHAAEITPKRASQNLEAEQEQARLSKFLATIDRHVPMEVDFSEMTFENLYNKEAYELFKRLEFKSMLDKFQNARMGRISSAQKEEHKFQRLLSIAECRQYAAGLEEGRETAYILFQEQDALLGIGFYEEKDGGVLAFCGEELSAEELLSCFHDFFTKKSYLKIAHDAKRDIKLLLKYGLEESKVVFDTAIAGYVLNSTRDSYEYNDIAGEFLEEVYPSTEEVLGKGKSRKPLSALSPDALLEYTLLQAEISFRAKPLMDAKMKENGQEKLYYEMEMPLLYVLSDMERYGIRINPREVREYREALEIHIDRLTQEIYQEAGEEFNINSPKQLGVILFEKLHLPSGKKTKTGYSTAAEVLEKLRYGNPIVGKILVYRQLAKLKSTYADGLLHVMNPETEKIYSTFNQTITATGRISSTEPNLQNIPIRLALGKELRKVFIPSSGEYLFLDADYSQIELRVLAHIAGDETLIDAFKNGQDIHRLTASQVLNIPFEEITDAQRSNAKAVNFGIVYGMGAFSLSQDLGITRIEAERYINNYFRKYPKVRTYMDKTIADAAERGYVETIFKRRRAMPELAAKNHNLRAFGERVAMNMPIQGSAADIIKIAMVKVSDSLKREKLRSRLILQVHDELLLEVHREELEQVAALVRQDMEHAVELSVPMLVDVHTGENWFLAK